MSNPIVSLQNVSAFHKKNPVLKGVNFLVNKGDFVYIIGKTGSGKSSIIQAVFRFIEICRGTIEIDGVDISKSYCIKCTLIPHFG